jgi:hypothetical protein
MRNADERKTAQTLGLLNAAPTPPRDDARLTKARIAVALADLQILINKLEWSDRVAIYDEMRRRSMRGAKETARAIKQQSNAAHGKKRHPPT